jgi:hypothetical protein
MKKFGWIVTTKDGEMKTGSYLADSERLVENFILADPSVVSCLVLEEVAGTLPCRYCGKRNDAPQEFCGVRCLHHFIVAREIARDEDGAQPEDAADDASIARATKLFEKPCIMCGKPCIEGICSDSCMHAHEMREAVEQSEVR